MVIEQTEEIEEETEKEITAESLTVRESAEGVVRQATIDREGSTTTRIPQAVRTEIEKGKNVTVTVATMRSGTEIGVQEEEMVTDLHAETSSMTVEEAEADTETEIRIAASKKIETNLLRRPESQKQTALHRKSESLPPT